MPPPYRGKGALGKSVRTGRLAATRDDILALAAPVLRHRLILSFAAEAEGVSPDQVVARLLGAVRGPGA